MKTLVNKIFLTVTFLFLSVSVWAALPEDNSIMRFESTDGGKTIYAVAMSDGTVKPLAEDDQGYIYVNTLWLVKHTGNETFTLQNVGTRKYLNYKEEGGTFSAKKVSLLLKDSPITIHADASSKYYIEHTSWFTTSKLYIQYDPNTNVWMYYAASGTNKQNSQSSGGWTDVTNPPANEKESIELSGSEVKDLFGDDHGNIDINDIKTDILNNPTKIEDYQEASSSTVTIVKVGNSSTYPTSNYWKQTNIELDINSSKWTPVSFPVYVEVIGGVADVWYQWYDAKERASSGNGWKKAQLTVGTKFEPGKAYNFATGSTANKTITFQPTSEENGTIIELDLNFTGKLDATGGTPKNENWYYIGNALFSDAVINGAVEYACKPDKNGGYIEVDLKNKSFDPFETFFVQFQGYYNLAKSTPSSASAAPMLNRGNVTEKYSVEINGEGNYYHTGIYFAEDASVDEYVSGEDFLSFANKKGAGVQLYSVEDDGDYAFNKRPIENTVVRLGLYVGTAGRYTISLNNISGNAETFVLYDNYEQDFVRLHLGETYTFYSERGEFNDRFGVAVTYAPEVTTDNISLSANKLIVVNNEIQGLTLGSELMVYDSTGRLVCVVNVDSETMILPNLNSGIYIARNGNGWVKFVVR